MTPGLAATVTAFRRLNAWSRAMAPLAQANTASRRTARCIFCGEVVATCAARYVATRAYMATCDAHAEACAAAWVRRMFPPAAAAALLAVDLDPDLDVRAGVVTAALAARAEWLAGENAPVVAPGCAS